MEALISGEGRPENLGKRAITRTSILCKSRESWISKEHISRTKILVMPQFSYMPDQILGKNENGQKFDLSLGSFPPKM